MSSSADWHYHMTVQIDSERSVKVRHTWFLCKECSREEGNDSKDFKCPPHGITEAPYDPDEFQGVVVSSGSGS